MLSGLSTINLRVKYLFFCLRVSSVLRPDSNDLSFSVSSLLLDFRQKYPSHRLRGKVSSELQSLLVVVNSLTLHKTCALDCSNSYKSRKAGVLNTGQSGTRREWGSVTEIKGTRRPPFLFSVSTSLLNKEKLGWTIN